MKVLILVTSQDSAHFQERLRSLDTAGVEYDVVHTPNIGNRYSPLLGDNLGSIFYNLESSSRFYPKVLQHSFFDDYDLIHAACGLTAPFALAQPNRPIVVTYWGSDLLGDGLFGQNESYCRLISKFADQTIVVSESMSEVLDRDCNIIPHAVDVNKFKCLPKHESRESVGWDIDKYCILFPYSKNRGVKRYEMAKEIVDLVNERYRSELDKPVELKRISGEPHERVHLYMNAADILLITSKHEGQPITVKEAMACNLPILSTDVGDVSNYISGVNHSHICLSKSEFADSMYEIIETEGSINSRENIKGYSIKDMGKKLESVYEKSLLNKQ